MDIAQEAFMHCSLKKNADSRSKRNETIADLFCFGRLISQREQCPRKTAVRWVAGDERVKINWKMMAKIET